MLKLLLLLLRSLVYAMSVELKQLSSNQCHGGHVRKYQHPSATLGCDMKVNVFIPNHQDSSKKFPVWHPL